MDASAKSQRIAWPMKAWLAQFLTGMNLIIFAVTEPA